MIINDYFSVNNAELILRNKNQFEEIIKNLSDKRLKFLTISIKT